MSVGFPVPHKPQLHPRLALGLWQLWCIPLGAVDGHGQALLAPVARAGLVVGLHNRADPECSRRFGVRVEP